MKQIINQHIENLPAEILALPRFLKTRADNPKRPVITQWQLPANQKCYSELDGTVGFVAATEQAGGLVMFDFDHCLNEKGEFVNKTAERWFNFLHAEEYFAEISASGSGLHLFALPTVGKFGKLNERLYFNKDKTAFLEIFYGATRFCLCTGNAFRCNPNAPIATGEIADDLLQTLLAEVEKQNPKPKRKAPAATDIRSYSDNHEFDLFRARRMLDAIEPARLTFNEWLTVLTCCFNIGIDYATFDAWCRRDTTTKKDGKPRYDASENYEHWTSRLNPEFGFGQLYTIAERFGFDAKATTKDWFDLHPELKQKRETAAERRQRQRAERRQQIQDNLQRIDELKAAPQSAERDAEIVSLIRDSCEYSVDRYGDPVAIKATAANLHLIFDNDPRLDGLIGYDEFVGADVFLKGAPWKPKARRGDVLSDRDAAHLRDYLSFNYHELHNRDRVDDTIITYSDKNKFHVIKEFFRNLPPWDKTPRAKELFIKFLRVADTPYSREVTLNWLLAAVARIFNPGCNYQLCPILKGNQGIGKSYILERIGGQWYHAISDNVDDPHAIDALINIWIGEFKELKAMRKADVNAIKAFIDTAQDNRRPAFERRAIIVPRHCVFIATVNDSEFLSDVTGNRRFPVLVCNSKEGDYVEGLTDEFIAQLWAEVFYRYCQMFNGHFDDDGDFVDDFNARKLELSRATKIEVETVAQNFMRDDGLTGKVQAFLDVLILPPVIWNLLTENERQKFIADRKITIERDNLHNRFYPANKKRPAEDLIKQYEEATKPSEFVKPRLIRTSYGDADALTFYGTEKRQHICAKEILQEAFDNTDRQKSMRRIGEILEQLDGWHQGARIGHDPTYGNQRKVYYRDADNQPTAEPPADNDDYDFGGEPIDPADNPFDL